MTDKKDDKSSLALGGMVDKSSLAIGGMTVLGVGVGFIFLQTSPLIFVACILIGVGLGLLIAAILK